MADIGQYIPNDTTLRKYSPPLLSILIIIIILADLLAPESVIIHWQMVALIGMLAILPFVPLIKRIYYGDLEVELGEQVREAEQTVEKDLPIPAGVETSDYLPKDIPEKLYEIYDISHIAALAMLRTEIEVVLREIAGVRDEMRDRPASYGELMHEIESEEKLSRKTLHAIQEVRALANPAIHEKGAEEDEAREVLELGINALERLYYYKEEGEPKD